MQCPVCKNHEHEGIDLRAKAFSEDLVECGSCGTTWSINHGVMAIVKDPHADTFLEALSADNFCFAAA
jgi:uncharacterized Zn finger protein